MNATFDDQLRQSILDRCRENGTSLCQLSIRSGVNQGNLTAFMKGRKSVGNQSINRLVDAMGTESCLTPNRKATMSATLDELAKAINEGHAECMEAAQATIRHLVDLGSEGRCCCARSIRTQIIISPSRSIWWTGSLNEIADYLSLPVKRW